MSGSHDERRRSIGRRKMVSEKKILPQNKKRLPWAVRLDTSELLGFIFSMLVSRAWNIGQPIMENLILVFGVVDDEQ